MDIISKQIYIKKEIDEKIEKICNQLNINYSGVINILLDKEIFKINKDYFTDMQIEYIKENFKDAGKVGRPSMNVVYEEKLKKINDFIQNKLQEKKLECATAIQVADWLEKEGLLNDSYSRPGLPLRNILRKERRKDKVKRIIKGAKQIPDENNGRWYIFDITKFR